MGRVSAGLGRIVSPGRIAFVPLCAATFHLRDLDGRALLLFAHCRSEREAILRASLSSGGAAIWSQAETAAFRTIEIVRDGELSTRAEAFGDDLGTTGGGGAMAPIVSSIEIARRPEEVFQYVTDPSRLPEWQESAVAARLEGRGPPAVGSRVVVTGRIGRSERTGTHEMTSHSPPRSWGGRGIDGPIRPILNGAVEPLDDGARSRVTIELDFEGHGIGKLLVPLMVRPRAQREMPRNMKTLKARLESGA
jgi:uncharacterized protein YndB with AHSA1/START domain